jgi:hypothetical protein
MLRRPVHLTGPLVLALLLLLASPAVAGWRAPVGGAVVGRFAVGPDPFAPGQRRGVDLAAPPGRPVVAPCSGRVAFAGALPRGGAGVSIRCGALTATVLGLAGPAVHAGASVARGDALGRAGPTGRIRLGARRTAGRFAYRDPLTLLDDDATPRPPVAPGARLAERRGRPARPRPAAAPPPSATSPDLAPAPAATPSHPTVPLLAWLGLALVAAALPVGALARAGRPTVRGQRAVPVSK